MHRSWSPDIDANWPLKLVVANFTNILPIKSVDREEINMTFTTK